MNLERALALEDSDYLTDLLERVIDNRELEEEFMEAFDKLPKCIQVDVITMGLTKIVMTWLNSPIQFTPMEEGIMFSMN